MIVTLIAIPVVSACVGGVCFFLFFFCVCGGSECGIAPLLKLYLFIGEFLKKSAKESSNQPPLLTASTELP